MEVVGTCSYFCNNYGVLYVEEGTVEDNHI